MKHLLVATLVCLGFSSTGCVFKPKSSSNSSAVSSPEHKNHGQQRKEEVHDRNDARKAEKDAEKANKK